MMKFCKSLLVFAVSMVLAISAQAFPDRPVRLMTKEQTER